MILLTDEEDYEVAINEQAIIMATWDPKKELTAVTCGAPDPWIWVKETPEEIYAAATGTYVVASDDLEACDGCTWQGHQFDDGAPCKFCTRFDEDQQDDHFEHEEEEETVHVSGVPYAVPLRNIKGCPSSRGENDATE